MNGCGTRFPQQCASPWMREGHENTAKMDDLKVNSPTVRKNPCFAYPSSKATRKGVEDPGRYMTKSKGRFFRASCSSTFPERSAARGWFHTVAADGPHILCPAQGGQCHVEFPVVYQGVGRGAGIAKGKLQLERNPGCSEIMVDREGRKNFV